MTTAKKKMYDESVHDCVINISKETQPLKFIANKLERHSPF